MKTHVSLAATLAILALSIGSAQASASLDPSFGKDGKVALPNRVEETWETVQLADGRIIVPGRDGLLALLPSGQIDVGFGVAGFAPLVLPPGAVQATVADLSVDSQGRLVVVGIAGLCTPGDNGCTNERNAALVERFDPNGNLDPGFGEGGFFTSDFGVAPPTPVQPTPGIGIPPPPAGQPPSVLARSGAIDSAGRIVISAQRLAGYQFHKGYFVGRYEAFVARLDADGEVDGAFAGGGVLPLPNAETLGRALVDAQGGFYLQSFADNGSTLMHLQPNGQADPGFGQGFGRGGAIHFRMPRLYTARIALDDEGRILVGAALKKQSKRAQRPALQSGMSLARLRPSGALDTTFGRRGTVEIPIPGKVELNIESITVRNGVVLLGAGGCGKGNCNRVLARVRLGSG